MAETRTTTVQVTVRKRAGEKAAALEVLPAGTAVEVVREEGRWVVVRVKNGEGYLARTTLSQPAPAAPAAPVWSAQRRVNGEVVEALYVDVRSATATIRSAPTMTGTTVGVAVKGARLAVLDASSMPSWVHVRDDQGHDGWVARAELGDGMPGVTAGGVERTRSDFRRAASRRLELRADAGVGYRSLGMDLTSNSAGGLSNYLVDADAIAVTATLEATLRPSGPWLVGVAGTLAASRSSPGIDYPGPTSAAGEIPFHTLASELGVRGGRRLGTALELSVRLAGHYDAFLTSNVDNAGMLPRERLLGATAGLQLDVRPPDSRFGATLRGDALVVGSRKQTQGLEDGTSSTARAMWGGIVVRVAISRRWAVFGAYDFARMSTTWTGTSARQPGVTRTERIDTSQLAQLGVGTEL